MPPSISSHIPNLVRGAFPSLLPSNTLSKLHPDLWRRVVAMSQVPQTPMSISHLFETGKKSTAKSQLVNTAFLHNEVCLCTLKQYRMLIPVYIALFTTLSTDNRARYPSTNTGEFGWDHPSSVCKDLPLEPNQPTYNFKKGLLRAIFSRNDQFSGSTFKVLEL